jgi:hypothetical protein
MAHLDQEHGATHRLRAQGSVEEVFKEALDNKKTFVKIIVQTNNLHFHPDFKGNDLDLIFTTQDNMLRVLKTLSAISQTLYLPAPFHCLSGHPL